MSEIRLTSEDTPRASIAYEKSKSYEEFIAYLTSEDTPRASLADDDREAKIHKNGRRVTFTSGGPEDRVSIGSDATCEFEKPTPLQRVSEGATEEAGRAESSIVGLYKPSSSQGLSENAGKAESEGYRLGHLLDEFEEEDVGGRSLPKAHCE